MPVPRPPPCARNLVVQVRVTLASKKVIFEYELFNKRWLRLVNLSPACQIENWKMWPMRFITTRQHCYAKVNSDMKHSTDHALVTGVMVFEKAANKRDH